MDFGLSEEQTMLQETLRGWAQNECPTTRLRELFDAGEGHDPALWSALAEMGVAGLAIAEEYGGAGLELLDLALVAEVLGEFAIPGPFTGHALAAHGVALCGSPDQRAAILPALASGEQIASVALHESDVAWGARRLDREARRRPRLGHEMLRAPRRAGGPTVGRRSGGWPRLGRREGRGRAHRGPGRHRPHPPDRPRHARRRPGRVRRGRHRRGLAAARRGRRAARGRRLRRGHEADRHRRRLLAPARAVRPADRAVPGDQAHDLAPRHGHRADPRALLVRGPRPRAPAGGGAEGRVARQGAHHGSRDARRPRVGRAARRLRIHLGVRGPDVVQADHARSLALRDAGRPPRRASPTSEAISRWISNTAPSTRPSARRSARS